MIVTVAIIFIFFAAAAATATTTMTTYTTISTSTYLQKRKNLQKWEGMTSHILLSILDFGVFPCLTEIHGSKM